MMCYVVLIANSSDCILFFRRAAAWTLVKNSGIAADLIKNLIYMYTRLKILDSPVNQVLNFINYKCIMYTCVVKF